MRTITKILVLISLLLPVQLLAGEIFGSIMEGDISVGEGVKVEIISPNKTTYTDTTDKNGAYRIFLKEKGKCIITIQYKGQTPSGELFSYDRSLRYDWVLEAKEGKYSLRRK